MEAVQRLTAALHPWKRSFVTAFGAEGQRFCAIRTHHVLLSGDSCCISLRHQCFRSSLGRITLWLRDRFLSQGLVCCVVQRRMRTAGAQVVQSHRGVHVMPAVWEMLAALHQMHAAAAPYTILTGSGKTLAVNAVAVERA